MIISKITEMHFNMLSPEIIKNMARVRIVSADLYDADGYPIEGGVMDPRLGVIDPGLRCRSCGGGIGECQGHFGYLELAKPVINVLYTKQVYQLLKITCRKCGRLTIVEDDKPVKKRVNFEKILTAPAACPHCKAKQKKINFTKPYAYYEDKDELSPVDIRERLEKITEKDLKVIGFNGGRPEWLILTLFLIPPVTMRPSITLETGEKSEDDLTHKLVDIVRINQSLKENIDIGAPEFIIDDLWELVQYHISTYFDNELTGAPLARHRSGRALKGLIQRLKSKEGRLRGNLLGKRVNFSARTVISPDPRLSINEVGVPIEIAQELTIPVYITSQRLKEAKKLIEEGKVNYVTRADGRRIKITEENRKEVAGNIQIDWTIERQIKDGDVALFNRQPSLHRVSVMAHRVKILPFKTFRINPSVCFPYNADFDGDEMNLHIPQTEETRAESSFLMEVQHNIISPKFGGPLIGLELDQISGVYLLTKHSTVMTREEASQLLEMADIDVDLPEGQESFSGREIFSTLLPKTLNILRYKANNSTNDNISSDEEKEHDSFVSIENGKIMTGAIDSVSVGAEKGKIINQLVRYDDKDVVRNFIDRAGKLGIAYLMKRGLSIGISDLDTSPEVKKDIKFIIEKAQKDSEDLISRFNSGELPSLPGLTPNESLEAQILNTLSRAVNMISEIISKNIKRSDIVNMFRAGAKGSLINTTQMSAVVGQETILGQRIKRGYNNRTLSHIKPYDLSPNSHGFVERGFMQGLTPFELFWNIMNGREGLMDKSLRTRKSGYMQRRLINALQDLKVKDDLTIRTSDGVVIQFMAGEDGVDPSKSDWGSVNWQEYIKNQGVV